MSVRNGLVAFGISAVAVLGGGASVHEAFEKADQLALERACDDPNPSVGKEACEGVVITPETTSITKTERDVYAAAGGVFVLMGAIGMIGAYREVSNYDPL